MRYAIRTVFRVMRIACCVFLLTACRFPGAVRPTVKIGLVAPFEGRYRYVGYDVIYAVRLAVREANAAGGVGGYSPSTGSGYHVELVAYDDGADPAMAVEQARKLAADPQVVAAIGHFREETTGASLSTYAEAGIPLVALAVLDPTFVGEGGDVYQTGPGAGAVASALLDWLEGSGQYQAALVTWGASLGVALERDAQSHRLRMWPVVSPENPGWLEKVLASGAEVVFCDTDPVTAGEVVAGLRGAGWQGAFLGGPELAAADFTDVAGDAAEGVVFVTPYPFPADVPDSADFVAAYRGVAPHVPPPGPLTLPAYEATWMLLEALGQDIATHGHPTREGAAAALAETERSDAPLCWYRIGVAGVPEQIP
jgi:branched-chain amino acid transport system substrate-binding protein